MNDLKISYQSYPCVVFIKCPNKHNLFYLIIRSDGQLKLDFLSFYCAKIYTEGTNHDSTKQQLSHIYKMKTLHHQNIVIRGQQFRKKSKR